MKPPLARALGLLGSALAGAAAAWVTAHGLRARRHLTEPPPAIARAATDRAFAAESALAESLGMTRGEAGEAPVLPRTDALGVWTLRVPVAARECVAVIAAVYGHHAPTALALQSVTDDPSRIATAPAEPITVDAAGGGVVTQVQWCQAEERPRQAVLETRAIAEGAFPRPLTGTVRYAVFRGSWSAVGGVAALRRGAPRAWVLRQFPPEYAVAEGDRAIPPGASPLGVAVPLRTQAARLIPGHAGTYRALYAMVKGRGTAAVNPRVDAAQLPGDPWESGLPNNFRELFDGLRGEAPAPRLHEPLFDGSDGRRRVLAVLDTGALGRGCVALHFTRLLFLHGATLRRHDAGGGDTELTPQANAVVDRRCPAAGVSLYSAPEGDREDWLLRVFALPEAPEAAGTATATAAESGAEPTPASGETPARRRHRRRRR